MGWRGALRSGMATYRRIERDNERQRRLALKSETVQRAADAVEAYDAYVARLKAIHQGCSPAVDWYSVRDQLAPEKPTRGSSAEDAARAALDRFRPSLLDRLLQRVERRRAALVAAVPSARLDDDAAYEAALATFREEHVQWEEEARVATLVLARDPAGYSAALAELAPGAAVNGLGSRIAYTNLLPDLAEVTLQVNGPEVLPTTTLTLTRAGNLSTRPMAKAAFTTLYEDYVCSCLLRIVGETFAVLPVDHVLATAVDNVLDSSIGHQVEATIVSVGVSRDRFNALRLDRIDPSDALRGFTHRMRLKRGSGFSAVDKLSLEDYRSGDA